MSSSASDVAERLFEVATPQNKRTMSKDGPKRKQLRRYERVAAQAFHPEAKAITHSCSLGELWTMASKGNDTVAYFTEWADPTDARRGVALSRLAQSLLVCFSELQKPAYGAVLHPKVAEALASEIKGLLPSLSILNGGKASPGALATLSQPSGAGCADEDSVREAAAKLFEWLAAERSPLRQAMALLSAGGVFYGAHTAERTARAFLSENGGRGNQELFVHAAVARLCGRSPDEVADDTDLLTQLISTPQAQLISPPQVELEGTRID